MTRTRADTTRARHCLRWRPVVGLTEGLRSELDWVADRQAGDRHGVRALGLARSS